MLQCFTSLISIVLDAFIFQYSVPLIIINCYTKVFPSLTITKPMQACLGGTVIVYEYAK